MQNLEDSIPVAQIFLTNANERAVFAVGYNREFIQNCGADMMASLLSSFYSSIVLSYSKQHHVNQEQAGAEILQKFNEMVVVNPPQIVSHD